MSGTPALGTPRPRPVSVRARLRPKSQLTLPEEVRRALRVNEGDEIEFRVEGGGMITVRGYISVPTDNAWLYAQHQDAWGTPDHGTHDRRPTAHGSVDALFAHLDALGAADA